MPFIVLFATLLLMSLSACATTPAEVEAGSAAANYTIETEGSSHRIVSLTSKPRDVQLDKAGIISRAQGCAARHFAYGDVTAKGSPDVLLSTRQTNVTVGAGQLIEAVDPANGLLVANNRVNYMSAMIPYSAQARVTIEAKDQKFRMVLAQPALLQRSTGYAPTDSFSPMNRIWGTGWQEGVNQLAMSADKVATCIAEKPQDW